MNKYTKKLFEFYYGEYGTQGKPVQSAMNNPPRNIDDMDVPPVANLDDPDTLERVRSYVKQANGVTGTPWRIIRNLHYKLHIVGINFKLPSEAVLPYEDTIHQLPLLWHGGEYGPTPEGEWKDGSGFENKFFIQIEMSPTGDGLYTVDVDIVNETDLDADLQDDDDFEDVEDEGLSFDDYVEDLEEELDESVISTAKALLSKLNPLKKATGDNWTLDEVESSDIPHIAQGMWYEMENHIPDEDSTDSYKKVLPPTIEKQVKKSLIKNIKIETVNSKNYSEDTLHGLFIIFLGIARSPNMIEMALNDTIAWRDVVTSHLKIAKKQTSKLQEDCGCDVKKSKKKDDEKEEILKEELNYVENALFLYSENDRTTYEKAFIPVVTGLLRKIKARTYSRRDAVEAFKKVVSFAITRYINEFDVDGIEEEDGWHIEEIRNMPMRSRITIAGEMADRFEVEANFGNYDDFLRSPGFTAAGYFDNK